MRQVGLGGTERAATPVELAGSGDDASGKGIALQGGLENARIHAGHLVLLLQACPPLHILGLLDFVSWLGAFHLLLQLGDHNCSS